MKEYAHFRSALKILMFSENDSWEICKLLAALLHMGNVDFESKDRAVYIQLMIIVTFNTLLLQLLSTNVPLNFRQHSE